MDISQKIVATQPSKFQNLHLYKPFTPTSFAPQKRFRFPSSPFKNTHILLSL